MHASRPKTFTAVLEHDPCNLGWTIARVPFDPRKLWPEMTRLRVRGQIHGAPFRTALFPDPLAEAAPGFYLLVNKALQRAAGVSLGGQAEFELAPDLEPRPAELPEELDALLDEAEGLRTWYGALSEYTRREIGKWIAAVKTSEARMRRAEQMGERLLSTMEAETEFPPLIERAFRAHPRARLGWQRMTPAQRRQQLFAVFYYRTPEARERRLARVIEDAEKRAG